MQRPTPKQREQGAIDSGLSPKGQCRSNRALAKRNSLREGHHRVPSRKRGEIHKRSMPRTEAPEKKNCERQRWKGRDHRLEKGCSKKEGAKA